MNEELQQTDRTTNDLLRQFLRNRDTPCPICGYNLRELTGHVCPECGKGIELRVGSPDLRFGLCMLSIVPMLMMTAFAIIFLLVTWSEGSAGPLGIYVITATGVLDAPAAWILYRKRAWFIRRDRLKQWSLCVTSWAAHVAVFVGSFIWGVP